MNVNGYWVNQLGYKIKRKMNMFNLHNKLYGESRNCNIMPTQEDCFE